MTAGRMCVQHWKATTTKDTQMLMEMSAVLSESSKESLNLSHRMIKKAKANG